MQNRPIDVQEMYYSNRRILFVGEGDFSFSSSLATQFGVANNIVATSLNSREDLQKKYHMDAIMNINNLTHRGAQVFHGVNARNMATKNGSLPLFGAGESFYDVINFNFPHAGFFGPEKDPKVIQRHKELMQYFFTNAASMLSPGGLVYVSHKCGRPYDDWNLQEQAEMNGLEVLGSTPFHSSDFPGYKNRRGAGKRAGETFILGKAAIYIFQIRDKVWIDNIAVDPSQTQKKNILLQISNLRSFKENIIKNGHASSKTPLLQIIATKVAHLENLKLGKKGQRKLNSLKLMLKVMHLVVETPLALHRITSLQATSSCKKTRQYWHRIQRLALEVLEQTFEEEQNIKLENLGFGAPKEGNGHTLLSEPCVEQNMCDSMKHGCPYKQQYELQVEGVEEIYVSGDNSDEVLLESEGEEKEDLFCVSLVETQIPHSTDQDVIEPENILLTGHKIEESNHKSTIGMYTQPEYQGSDEDQGDMQGDEVLGICMLPSGDMEGEDFPLESKYSFAKGISNWMCNYIFSCFDTTSYRDMESSHEMM